jgi:hypothetical protein
MDRRLLRYLSLVLFALAVVLPPRGISTAELAAEPGERRRPS